MTQAKDTSSNIKSRRELMVGSLALVATAMASNAFAGKSGHEHHHHGRKNTALVDSLQDCIKTAQYCRDHCIELIKAGDSTLGDCLEAVTDTIPMCEAVVQLAVSDSRHLKSLAKVCIDVCKDCEKECRKHKGKHEECKLCMEACISCIEQLEKLVA